MASPGSDKKRNLSRSPFSSRLRWSFVGTIVGSLAAIITTIYALIFDMENGSIFTYQKSSSGRSSDLEILVVIVLGSVTLLLTMFSLFLSTYQASKRRAALDKIHAEEKRYAEDALELKEIWAVNQQRLDYYHEIAITQSKMSFISTQIATGLGFALIIIVGWIASQATDPLATITAGAVGIVGGGLSAFIGATFMKSQSRASAQLQQFFLHPVEYSRLLGAERLIEGLDSEQKADAVKIIVEAMMRSQENSHSKNGT